MGDGALLSYCVARNAGKLLCLPCKLCTADDTISASTSGTVRDMMSSHVIQLADQWCGAMPRVNYRLRHNNPSSGSAVCMARRSVHVIISGFISGEFSD